jgi:hypothetical protein
LALPLPLLLLLLLLLLLQDVATASSTFLGMVGMIGTHYCDSHVTTGFANHLARPLFREAQADDMSEEAAVALMHEALRVCYYRLVQHTCSTRAGMLSQFAVLFLWAWTRSCIMVQALNRLPN